MIKMPKLRIVENGKFFRIERAIQQDIYKKNFWGHDKVGEETIWIPVGDPNHSHALTQHWSNRSRDYRTTIVPELCEARYYDSFVECNEAVNTLKRNWEIKHQNNKWKVVVEYD
jgi:hypothetical protein